MAASTRSGHRRAVVLRNFGGSIAGHTSEAGLHLKAPGGFAIGWDIRNRQINFFKDSEYAYDGGSYEGAEVSINDASGTKANIDIQVIYSLDADQGGGPLRGYGTQEAFVTNYVSNDLRATAREVAGKYDTLTLLTDRAKFTDAVQGSLSPSSGRVRASSWSRCRFRTSVTRSPSRAPTRTRRARRWPSRRR
ncbi:MAG: SPFH domain-containing protein [Collinsella sp.]